MIKFLSQKISINVKVIKHKFEKLYTYRATNNQVIDNYKYYTLFKIKYHIEGKKSTLKNKNYSITSFQFDLLPIRIEIKSKTVRFDKLKKIIFVILK